MTPAAAPILSADQLEVRRRDRREGRRYHMVASTIRLCDGDRYALAAPNGAGKSTLLALLSLVLAPDSAAHFAMRLDDDTEVARAGACCRPCAHVRSAPFATPGWKRHS